MKQSQYDRFISPIQLSTSTFLNWLSMLGLASKISWTTSLRVLDWPLETLFEFIILVFERQKFNEFGASMNLVCSWSVESNIFFKLYSRVYAHFVINLIFPFFYSCKYFMIHSIILVSKLLHYFLCVLQIFDRKYLS